MGVSGGQSRIFHLMFRQPRGGREGVGVGFSENLHVERKESGPLGVAPLDLPIIRRNSVF